MHICLFIFFENYLYNDKTYLGKDSTVNPVHLLMLFIS